MIDIEVKAPLANETVICNICGVHSLVSNKSEWRLRTSISFQIGTISGYVSESINICSKCFSKLTINGAQFIEKQILFNDEGKLK